MAEAYAKQFLPDNWEVSSAGIEKHGLNPYMLQVMAEVGIDMSAHFSKTTQELPPCVWDIVMTVCAHAEETCPYMPCKKHIHLGFEDPPKLTQGLTKDEEILAIYRNVRDQIKHSLQQFAKDEN